MPHNPTPPSKYVQNLPTSHPSTSAQSPRVYFSHVNQIDPFENEVSPHCSTAQNLTQNESQNPNSSLPRPRDSSTRLSLNIFEPLYGALVPFFKHAMAISCPLNMLLTA